MTLNKKVRCATTFDFSYSGITVCDECGGPLCGQSGTGRNGKYFYYGHTKKTNCKIQRYSAEAFEKLIRKQLFSLINNEAMSEQFVKALSGQIKNRPKISKALLDKKRREIEKTKLENEKLVNLVADNPMAKELDALLGRIKENEQRLEKLESEKLKLEEKSLWEIENKAIDPNLILDGIKKLRQDSFRKAKVSKKRAIVQEAIKSIRVHPDNVIQIDFCVDEYRQFKALGKTSDKRGIVLPFRKLGRPLEASFRRNASREDKFSGIKKAIGLGTYVLGHDDFLMVAGSSSVGHGGTSRI